MEGAHFERVITRRPNLRTAFPSDFISRLEGQTVQRLTRRGKYLLAELSSGETLVMHLGMSGWFYLDLGRESTHDHVVFRMSSGAIVTFNDPRRFGFMNLFSPSELSQHGALKALGPEPLSPEFDAAALARACKGKQTTLKAALSDQRVVAGLGNIYVVEALHRARLSPKRKASTIATRTGAPTDAARRLVDGIKKALDAAISGNDRFRVYDREGARCPRAGCSGSIKWIVQGGRSTFFCPVCQK